MSETQEQITIVVTPIPPTKTSVATKRDVRNIIEEQIREAEREGLVKGEDIFVETEETMPGTEQIIVQIVVSVVSGVASGVTVEILKQTLLPRVMAALRKRYRAEEQDNKAT